MVRVVDEITFDVASGVWILSGINQHRVVDREARVGREIRDKKITVREDIIESAVRLLLILGAALIKHPEVSWPKVSWPTGADIFLQHRLTRFANLAQICVARKNNALFRRQCFAPWRGAGDRAHSSGQGAIVERLAMRIEAGELVKLHCDTRHHEAAARVAVRRIGFSRRRPKKSDAFVIFEDGGVRESECVAIEIKV